MSLSAEAGRGVAWMTAGKTVAQFVGVGVSLVLARLLTPEDFGLLGMVVVLVGFLAVLSDLGLTAALIQREDLQERHRSSVFWLMCSVGFVLAGLLALSAPYVAAFYKEQRLTTLVRVLAIDFALWPFIAAQHAVLSRRMAFKAIAMAETVSVVVGGGVALTLALLKYGVWALVAKALASSAALLLTFWIASDWRPRFAFDRGAISDLFRFSSNLLGHNIVGYWSHQTDDLLIGRRLGATPLGLYTRAYSTVMLPVREVGTVLGRVMFPTLSKMQSEPKEMKRLYLRVVGATALLTFPAMAVLFVVAEPLTLVVFGDQWLGIVAVLRIYAVVGAFQAIASTVNWIYKACGRTDLMFRWGIVSSIVIVAAVLVGTQFGSIEAIALSYGIALVVLLSYPHFAIPGRLIGLSPMEVFKTVVGIAAAALLTGGFSYGLGFLTASFARGLDLAIRMTAAGVVYLTCLKLLRVPVYVELREAARQRLLAWAGADSTASIERSESAEASEAAETNASASGAGSGSDVGSQSK